jgi:ammonium transporter, Amt family
VDHFAAGSIAARIIVYFPFVRMVWNSNGILAKSGVLDFAGGMVVHNTVG